MADIFTRAKRSAVMALIKGRNNQSTERVIVSMLRRHRIVGWRRHLSKLPGRPDIAFPGAKLAVFIDGCFWHGCTKCRRNLKPASNSVYWAEKLRTNRRRDRRVSAKLRRNGWHVIRIWEHDIKKNPEMVMSRIRKRLV